MNITTAGTADDDVMGAVTKERQLLSGCQRQCVTLVLQQHHAFRGSLARDPCMGIQIGPVADGLMTEGSRPHDQVEDAFDVSIQHPHIKLAISRRVQQCLLLRLGAGHQQVVACLHLLHGVRPRKPVRHHDTFEAPFIAQHVLQQPGAFRGVGSVDLVVGSHDRPRTAFLDGDLEALQVQLAQRTLADLHVDGVAVPFMVVGCVMLGRRAHILRLDAADHGGGHLAGNQRILRVVLEVSATQRIAMQVQGRRQKDIDPIGRRLRPHGLAHTFDQRIVP